MAAWSSNKIALKKDRKAYLPTLNAGCCQSTLGASSVAWLMAIHTRSFCLWIDLFVQGLAHTLVGFEDAERAPLHKDPSKTCSLLWLFAPEVPFSRILSHPSFISRRVVCNGSV